MIINIWILVCLVISFYYRLSLDNKVIISGEYKNRQVRRSVYTNIIRFNVLFMSLLIYGTKGLNAYADWFKVHNSLLGITMITISLLVLSILWLFKEASFNAQLSPELYQDTPKGSPYKVRMGLSLIWNTLFYIAVIFNPSLPVFNVMILKHSM